MVYKSKTILTMIQNISETVYVCSWLFLSAGNAADIQVSGNHILNDRDLPLSLQMGNEIGSMVI